MEDNKMEIDVNCLYINGLGIKSKEEWDLVVNDYYKVKQENKQQKELLDKMKKEISSHNEMVIKIISECEEMTNNRYFMNEIAIKKKADEIKLIANHYYVEEPKWVTTSTYDSDIDAM